jgi:NAD+ diphosphatase
MERNFFSACCIDRLAVKRNNAGWVAERMADEMTRFIPVWRQKNLFSPGPDVVPAFLGAGDVEQITSATEFLVLLGQAEQQVFFAVGLASNGDTPPDAITERGEFRDVRQMAPLLNAQDGALLAYARAMVYWHAHHRFCGDCGSPTASAQAGFLRVCTNPACGQKQFPRTDPAIIVLVAAGEYCLLGRQPTWPAGMHSTIAGFVEPGESLEDAVIREVREETGVQVRTIQYHSSQPWPFPSSLMLGFTAHAADREIFLGDHELEAAAWFTRDELRDKLKRGTIRLPSPVSISFRLIENWFDDGGGGSLRELVGAA